MGAPSTFTVMQPPPSPVQVTLQNGHDPTVVRSSSALGSTLSGWGTAKLPCPQHLPFSLLPWCGGEPPRSLQGSRAFTSLLHLPPSTPASPGKPSICSPPPARGPLPSYLH